jgi:hypothetical protein
LRNGFSGRRVKCGHVDTLNAFWLHRRVKLKLLVALVLLFGTTACVTLENRRDLYSPDVELYPRPVTTRTVTRKTTTRTTPENKPDAKPEFRPTAPEPEETPALPPP